MKSSQVALKKHVKIEVVGKEGLDDFAKIMKLTEDRKHIRLRNRVYFERLMDAFPQTSRIFLAKVDSQIRYDELKTQIVDIENELKREKILPKNKNRLIKQYQSIEKEMLLVKKLMEKYPGTHVIAVGLMIGFGKKVEMLYAGMNVDFKSYRPQYLTYLKKFEYYFQLGYEHVTMGGVEGTLDDGLSQYKLAYQPIVNEYIGEFDLPVYPSLYYLSQLGYHLRRKIMNHKEN